MSAPSNWNFNGKNVDEYIKFAAWVITVKLKSPYIKGFEDDLIQDLSANISNIIAKFNPDRKIKFETYFYSSVRNLVFQFIKKRKRETRDRVSNGFLENKKDHRSPNDSECKVIADTLRENLSETARAIFNLRLESLPDTIDTSELVRLLGVSRIKIIRCSQEIKDVYNRLYPDRN